MFCDSFFVSIGSLKTESRVQLFATPWTVAHQASLSMELSRQEYWSGLPFPSPGDLPNPGIEPGSPALQADSSPFEPPGKPCDTPLLSLFTSYSCLYEGILLFLPLYPLQALHLRYCPLWALLTFKKPSYSSCCKLSNQICSLRHSDHLSFHRNYFFSMLYLCYQLLPLSSFLQPLKTPCCQYLHPQAGSHGGHSSGSSVENSVLFLCLQGFKIHGLYHLLIWLKARFMYGFICAPYFDLMDFEESLCKDLDLGCCRYPVKSL